ncbi:MAG TPA: hydantoinase/oxoprolinase family protein [Candidatus Limnocylindrales bacterium]|nr:hydantoinase/oxoprolinase family protein [Candidatus Limnocylindrales bacterium]
MGHRLGIDVGGTFTDLVLYDDASHALAVAKVPSIPADPSQGIVDGIVRLLRETGVAPGAVDYVAHGTTVATNALLERKGARTALITTRGFRDLLEIARQKRPSLYDLSARKPVALVPRHRRHEVTERVMADGSVRIPLVLQEVDDVLERSAEASDDGPVEALAICFLYSFLTPEHERQVLDRARKRFPDLAVVASHEVHPEFREYERLSTTVANAYLAPRMGAYVRAFRRRVEGLGIPALPYINQSNGGTMSVEEAARVPVRTALSGPSAGVAGAAWIAAQAGFDAIATFDMGGTSTDVAFVRDGRPGLTFEREIGGVPLRVPALDIHTVGAGGGSIAWRDSGGALKVGPQSAGADPGPACYGRGGEAPTVTDANLVLGRLGTTGLAGGAVPLDPARAEAAVARLARDLGLSTIETARGIIRVVNANMANAVRVVTVQRGVDPTGLSLVPFGGAGPLHAAELARELGIPTIAVPPGPGLLCALGLLVEDLRTDAVRTHLALLEPAGLPALAARFEEMERDATVWLDRERVTAARRRLERWLDLRYVGQNFELLVPVPEETWRDGDDRALRRRFLEAHEQVYGFAAPDEPIQVVNTRVVARGLADPPRLARVPRGGPDPGAAELGRRPVHVDDQLGVVACPVYDRARLLAGHRLAGPAVVEQFDATTLLLPGQEAVVDEIGFIVIQDPTQT